MSIGTRLLRWSCLGALGALSVPGGDAALSAGAAVLALAAGGGALLVLDRLLRLGLRDAGPGEAAARAGEAIDAGFLMLLPYAVIATLVAAGSGWSLTPALVGAGLLTAGGIAGAELSRRGGHAVWCALAPMLVLVPLAAGWSWLAAMAQGGAP